MINRVTKGDRSWTMMHEALANQVIDGVNKLELMSVSPTDVGWFRAYGDNIVLELSGLDDHIKNLLKSATWTHQCNSDGTISTTVSFS